MDDKDEIQGRGNEETDRWNNRCARVENRSNRGREGIRRTTATLVSGGRGERDGLAGGRARVDGQIRSLSAV